MSDVTLEVADDDVFLIRGEETVEKEVKPQGNGAHVIIPKRWIGAQVKITRISEPEHDDE
jgi:putative transposon-encoded protein